MPKKLRKERFTQTVSHEAWIWLNKQVKETGAASVPEVIRQVIAEAMKGSK
ncbi:MAG: hypothetical protein ACHQ03_10090 [Candidatus Bathyarchaeia archaeon]